MSNERQWTLDDERVGDNKVATAYYSMRKCLGRAQSKNWGKMRKTLCCYREMKICAVTLKPFFFHSLSMKTIINLVRSHKCLLLQRLEMWSARFHTPLLACASPVTTWLICRLATDSHNLFSPSFPHFAIFITHYVFCCTHKREWKL